MDLWNYVFHVWIIYMLKSLKSILNCYSWPWLALLSYSSSCLGWHMSSSSGIQKATWLYLRWLLVRIESSSSLSSSTILVMFNGDSNHKQLSKTSSSHFISNIPSKVLGSVYSMSVNEWVWIFPRFCQISRTLWILPADFVYTLKKFVKSLKVKNFRNFANHVSHSQWIWP